MHGNCCVLGSTSVPCLEVGHTGNTGPSRAVGFPSVVCRGHFRHGIASLPWFGMVWYGRAWYSIDGMLYCGVVWYGVVLQGAVWLNMVGYGRVW